MAFKVCIDIGEIQRRYISNSRIVSFENIDKEWLAIIMQAGVDDMAAAINHDRGFDDLALALRWYFWSFLIDDSAFQCLWPLYLLKLNCRQRLIANN
jgi:hypothetical protein